MFWPDGVPRYQETPSELVYASIGRWAEKAADKIAVSTGNDSITYSELERKSDSVASHLSSIHGLATSLGPNIPSIIEAIIGLLAILKVGSSFVCGSKVGNVESVLSIEDIRKWSAEGLSGWHQIELAPSTAAFSFSQGETNVTRSHECYVSGLASFTVFMGMNSDSATLIPYSLSGDFGTFALFCALYSGGTAVLTDGFDSAEKGLPTRSRDNWCFARMEDLFRSAKKRSSAGPKVRCNYLVASDGSSSPDKEKGIEKTLGSELLTMYYSAETGVAICRHPSWYLPSSVGIPVTNFEVRIGQEYYGNLFEMVNPDMKGEVLINGPMIEPVRYGRLEETVGIVGYTNSWTRTRRRGMLDHNGLFYLDQAHQ